MNRNFNNQSIVTDDAITLIQQNNASNLQKANIFTAKQTFDEIGVNKITITPIGNSISIGSTLSTLTNSTAVGVGCIAGPNSSVLGYNSSGSKSNDVIVGVNSSTNGDNNIIIGNSSGNTGSLSLYNIYIGNNVSHTLNATFSNSVAIGHGSSISSNNTVFLGTSSQYQQLYRPIISNPPLLDYMTYPTLVSNQIGFVKTITSSRSFANTLDAYQNMATISLPIGCYSIVYQMTFLTSLLSSNIDKFLCNVSLADNISNYNPYQVNVIPCRIDIATSINGNASYSNSLVLTNNSLTDKTYFLNVLFYASEMGTINPSKYTCNIKIDATRLS